MSADWTALDATLAGDVLLPGTDAYEQTRRPAVARFHDVRPAAVVRCATAEDVVAALAAARRAGLPVAVRGGGHCFAGRSSTAGVVLDTGAMRSVALSAGAELATIGAGARLGDVYDALAPHGRTVVAGCGPTVGIAGLALGGGLGVLGRRYGLTSDSVLGARVVLADGRVLDCDGERHADLLWALRGGGGGVGVVTSLTLRTVPAPAATVVHATWPAGDLAAVLGAWQGWAPPAPDELAASLLLIAPGSGAAPSAHVFGVLLGPEEEAAQALGALADGAGAEPASTALHHLPYREAKRHLAEHGPGEDDDPSAHAFSKSEFFRGPLPRDAAAALVGHLRDDRRPGQARVLDLTPWGGAYNRVDPGATAFPHRAERFLLKHEVAVPAAAGAAERDAALTWLEGSWALVHPWGSGGAYPNFPDPGMAGWPRAAHGPNLERLAAITAVYDPHGVFAAASPRPTDDA